MGLGGFINTDGNIGEQSIFMVRAGKLVCASRLN